MLYAIVIGILLMVICGYVCYKIGYARTCHIVQENNAKVLADRNKILSQIDDEKQNLASISIEYNKQCLALKKNIENFEKLEKENILSNLRDFQIQVNEQKGEYAEEIRNIQNELEKIKRQKAATIEALQREKTIQETKDDYRIIISDEDKTDIEILNSFKYKLSNPEILSKLIWSTYYQKKAKDLFIRLLSSNVVCGIYKITNIDNEKCYIGQSVDVAKRFTQHCRCGCGIKTPQNNKFYSAMMNSGLDRFTFELLEECPQEELNEKESYYIKLYNSVDYGYNSIEGVNG